MKLIIEIDGPNNGCWHAPFLQRDLRGRFDYARVKEPMAAVEAVQFPGGIPGQRLMIDTDKKLGAVLEPLTDDRYAETRRKLSLKLGTGGTPQPLGLGEPVQEIELKGDRDVPTWLFWMRRAVEGGHARVVSGDLPKPEQCKGARKQFYTPEPPPPSDDLLRRQELAARLAMMTPDQRREYERLVSAK